MKKKIIIRNLFHRNEWRYGLFFDYDPEIHDIVRSIPGIRWSNTNTCWHTTQHEESLKNIFSTLRGRIDIDISAIAIPSYRKESLLRYTGKYGPYSSDPELSVGQDDLRGTGKESASDSGDSTGKTDRETAGKNDLNSINKEGIQKQDRFGFPDAETKTSVSVSGYGRYGAVKFSIHESTGMLIIKFLGRYDRSWIDELRSYGYLRYDKEKREWHLKWSQVTVDSLSDYFGMRGIKVIIEKTKVSSVIRENRDAEGSDVRSREINNNVRKEIDAVYRYMVEKRYSKHSINSYISHLQFFFKYFKTKESCEITEKDIETYIHDFIISNKYSASYQNQSISAIKLFYHLHGGNRINSSVFERPRRPRPLPKVLSKEEVMQIFNATRNSKHKLILWIVYSCGLRRSELINIRLKDLDQSRGILHIREGKGGVDRVVPIPQKIWEKINIYLRSYGPREYLFEGQNGGQYSVESVYNIFKKSLRRAGIKKEVGIHSLRHSYATHLHEKGLDIRYIQELLGHKSTRTTEIYTHVSRRDLFQIKSPIEDMDID